jgi:signal recognition particle subunit SEC65
MVSMAFSHTTGRCIPKSTRIEHASNNKIERFEAKRRENRAAWLTEKKQHPEATYSDLVRKMPARSSWLRVHDQVWLKENSPSSSCRKAVQRKLPKDRGNQDQDMADQVKQAAHCLRNTPGYPVRITRIAIAASIKDGVVFTSHKLKQLPLTNRALEEAIETSDSFALRKIQWITEHSQQEGIPLTRRFLLNHISWDLIKKYPKVKKALDLALARL